MSIETVQSVNSVQNDLELNGQINLATGEAAKFVLLLAMLQDSPLDRPQYHDTPDEALPDPLLNNHYRNPPLSAETRDWENAEIESQLLHRNSQDIFLWRALHPQPLSVYDDVKRVDDEVKANCSIFAQRRMQELSDNGIQVDATKMYDIVQQARTAA